jgi:hypothetical protein
MLFTYISSYRIFGRNLGDSELRVPEFFLKKAHWCPGAPISFGALATTEFGSLVDVCAQGGFTASGYHIGVLSLRPGVPWTAPITS